MIDYKELIEELMFLSTHHVPEDMCDDDGMDALEKAATAIENLLAERDALLDALRGSCGDCVFRETKKCEEPCAGCYHAPQHFCEPPNAYSCLSDNWQWKGIGGKDEP